MIQRLKYTLLGYSTLHKFSLLIIVLFTASSCNEAVLYSESHTDFPENRWYQTNPVAYEFEVTNDQSAYDITLGFRYVYGAQFKEIPIEVYITTPQHHIEKIPVTLYLSDENGNDLGDCMGDYCDLNTMIKQNYKFDAVGTYKVQILNKFDYEYLPNVMAMRWKVEASK